MARVIHTMERIMIDGEIYLITIIENFCANGEFKLSSNQRASSYSTSNHWDTDHHAGEWSTEEDEWFAGDDNVQNLKLMILAVESMPGVNLGIKNVNNTGKLHKDPTITLPESSQHSAVASTSKIDISGNYIPSNSYPHYQPQPLIQHVQSSGQFPIKSPTNSILAQSHVQSLTATHTSAQAHI